MPPKYVMQKVLLIDLGGSFGGVESYLVSLAELLRGEVELHALCVLPELAERLKKGGVTTIVVPGRAGWMKPLRFLIALIRLPLFLLWRGIDTVQVNGFLEATLMLPARLLGRQTVYTRHGPFELEEYRWYRQPLKVLPRMLARSSVPLATTVVCVSEAVGAGVRAMRPKVTVTVIPNWVARQGEPRTIRAIQGKPRLMTAGRLERYKGVHLAIEAVRGVAGASLTVVGDGPYRETLKASAEGLAVEFAGFQLEMEPFYEAADIFLMPSLGPEGMPMSSLEAMGRGLPCVLSDLPVHREISENGRGAMLFRVGDAASLRSAIEALAGDPELRARVGQSAYEIVRDRYTAERVRDRYLRVFGGR